MFRIATQVQALLEEMLAAVISAHWDQSIQEGHAQACCYQYPEESLTGSRWPIEPHHYDFCCFVSGIPLEYVYWTGVGRIETLVLALSMIMSSMVSERSGWVPLASRLPTMIALDMDAASDRPSLSISSPERYSESKCKAASSQSSDPISRPEIRAIHSLPVFASGMNDAAHAGHRPTHQYLELMMDGY